jgi:hypothetical protein
MTLGLLAVSWAMPPLVYPRAIQVSRTLKELSRRGWSVDVIALDPRANVSAEKDQEFEKAYCGFYRLCPIDPGPASGLLSAMPRPWFSSTKERQNWLCRNTPPSGGPSYKSRRFLCGTVVPPHVLRREANLCGVIVTSLVPISEPLAQAILDLPSDFAMQQTLAQHSTRRPAIDLRQDRMGLECGAPYQDSVTLSSLMSRIR